MIRQKRKGLAIATDSAEEFKTKRVLAAAGGHFIHDIYTGFLPPFIPLIVERFGVSIMLAGTLAFYYRIPSTLNPILGLICERVELKLLFILAPALSAAGMCLLGQSPSYACLALILVAVGTTTAFYHALGPVLIAQSAGRRVGQGMGLWSMGGELARTVGPLAAVGIVAWRGFDGAYPFMVVGGLASVSLYLFFRSAKTTTGRKDGSSPQETWRVLRPVVLPLAAVVFFRSLTAQALSVYLPAYVVSKGQSLWFGGFCLAAFELAGTAGTFAGGYLSDRLGRRSVLLTTTLVSAFLLLVFIHLPVSAWTLIPAALVLGLSVLASMPVMMALMQDHAQGLRASANGFFMGLQFGGGAVVIFLVGAMVDWLGFQTAFLISGLAGLAGAPVALLLPKAAAQSLSRSASHPIASK
jgi:MFS transporter, FSR family, fosmidomycin resistance protein